MVLIISLATENATARMRAWRSLKAAGAAVLRDGVYLLPELARCRATMEAVAADVRATGGAALLLRVEEPAGAAFVDLFERNTDYAALIAEVGRLRSALPAEPAELARQARKLRKTLTALVDIDFFPGEARRQAERALHDLEADAARVLSPGEPVAVDGGIARLEVQAFRGRTWATRRRPWVDRLACAWLIRRFIDPAAVFLFVAPSEVAAVAERFGATPFDIEGVFWSHRDELCTFDVMLDEFALHGPALDRLALIIRGADTARPDLAPEAAGLLAASLGLSRMHRDDLAQLDAGLALYDAFYRWARDATDETHNWPTPGKPA